MAAEYILKEGNESVMLCERGIRTFETAYRFTLDLTAIPVLKELTHLPVVVDPSPRRRPPRARRAAARWPRPPRAPTASSSRSTPSPRRRSATARRQLRADDFADVRRQGRAGRDASPASCRSAPSAARGRDAAGDRLVRASRVVGRRARSAARSGWPRAAPGRARHRLGPRPAVRCAPRSSAARSTSPRRSPRTRDADVVVVAAPVRRAARRIVARRATRRRRRRRHRRRLDQARARRRRRRRALHRRPPARGRRGRRRRARARRTSSTAPPGT